MTIARVAVAARSGNRKLSIEELRLPGPGPHQIALKLFASGICHSQLHQLHQPGPEPIIFGHEATGIEACCCSRL